MYTSPYSKAEITFDLLPGMKGTRVHSQSMAPLADLPAEIKRSLTLPMGYSPLREIAKKGDSEGRCGHHPPQDRDPPGKGGGAGLHHLPPEGSAPG